MLPFDKKEKFIEYLDMAYEACQKESGNILDSEGILYETNDFLNECNKTIFPKFNDIMLQMLVDNITGILDFKTYYIRKSIEIDWSLSSFGTAFFTYKDTKMFVTTMVGQGSLDLFGFYHDGLKDEFDLWKKTNLFKTNLFPDLKEATDEFYEERRRKENDEFYTSV